MNKLEHAYFQGFIKAAGEGLPEELLAGLKSKLESHVKLNPELSSAIPEALPGSPIPKVAPANFGSFKFNPKSMPTPDYPNGPAINPFGLPSKDFDQGLTTGTAVPEATLNETSPLDPILAKGRRPVFGSKLNNWLESKLGKPGSQSASQAVGTVGLGLGAGGAAGYTAKNLMPDSYHPVKLAPDAAIRKTIEDLKNNPANHPVKGFIESALGSVKNHWRGYLGGAAGGAGLAALTHYLHNRKPKHPGLSEEPGVDESEIQ